MKKLSFILLFPIILYAQDPIKSIRVKTDSVFSLTGKHITGNNDTLYKYYWGGYRIDTSKLDWTKFPFVLYSDSTVKYVTPTRSILTGNGLSGGGTLFANRTLTADTSILATKLGVSSAYLLKGALGSMAYADSTIYKKQFLKNADSTTLKNSINTGGTLTNLAYKDQANTFTGANIFQTAGVATAFTVKSTPSNDYGRLAITAGTNTYTLVVGAQSSTQPDTFYIYSTTNSKNIFSLSNNGVIRYGTWQAVPIDTTYTLGQSKTVSGNTFIGVATSGKAYFLTLDTTKYATSSMTGLLKYSDKALYDAKKANNDSTSATGYTTRATLRDTATALSSRINAKGTGTVTSVGTADGILGGTITSTGTIKADTTFLVTRYDTLLFLHASDISGKVNRSDSTTIFYTPTQAKNNVLYSDSTVKYVTPTRSVLTGNGLSGGGTLFANRTLVIDSSITQTVAGANSKFTAKTSLGTEAQRDSNKVPTLAGTQTFTGVNTFSNSLHLDDSQYMFFGASMYARSSSSQSGLFRAYDDAYIAVWDTGVHKYLYGGGGLKINDATGNITTGVWNGTAIDSAYLSMSKIYSGMKSRFDPVYAPLSHTQAISTITNLQDSLNNKWTKGNIIDQGSIGGSFGAINIGSNALTAGAINVGTLTALTPSYFGYSAAYKVLQIGTPAENQSLAFGVDLLGNTSGAFSGNGCEYIWKNVGKFITPNAANDGYNVLFDWNSLTAIQIGRNLGVSGTLIADGAITANTGVIRLQNYAGTADCGVLFFGTDYNDYIYNSYSSLYVRVNGVDRLIISDAGLATFSNDVTYLLRHAVASADSISYAVGGTGNTYYKIATGALVTKDVDSMVVAGDSIQVLTPGDYEICVHLAASTSNANDQLRIRAKANNVFYSPQLSRWTILSNGNSTNIQTYEHTWYLISCTRNSWLSFYVNNLTGNRAVNITDFGFIIKKLPEQ